MRGSPVCGGLASVQQLMGEGLDSSKGYTLDGRLPSLTLTAGKPHPVDCWFTGGVLNGQTQLLNGGKETCSPTP